MNHSKIAGWKFALGLAIVAAIGAPFACDTWQPRANAEQWIALTPELRASLVAKLESSKNCRYFETQVEARDVLGLKVDSDDIREAMQCHREQDALRDGGEAQAYFSLPRYLAVNSGVALVGAFSAFGLAMAVPVLVRRTRRPGRRTKPQDAPI
jgi:hypothetical protein